MTTESMVTNEFWPTGLKDQTLVSLVMDLSFGPGDEKPMIDALMSEAESRGWPDGWWEDPSVVLCPAPEIAADPVRTLAQELDGSDYLWEPSREDVQRWERLGLVVIYGYSDDELIFQGAISDGLSVYGDFDFELFSGGRVLQPGEVEAANAEDYVAGKNAVYRLRCRARWEHEGYSWWLGAEGPFPWAPFNIFEDGDLFCRGLVVGLRPAEPVAQNCAADAQVISDRWERLRAEHAS